MLDPRAHPFSRRTVGGLRPIPGCRRVKLDPFYLILDSADWIERLLPSGVQMVQLRIKDRPEAELRREIRRARDLCAAGGVQFVVNDYWRLAIELGCDFVHLGQEDLQDADIGAIRAAGLRFGVSTQDEDELERALALRPDCIALQPVYATFSKLIACAPQGLDRVGKWKRRIGDVPLIGVGGIRLERARDVFEAGADVAAVVSDVTGDSHPEERARAWVAATRGQLR